MIVPLLCLENQSDMKAMLMDTFPDFTAKGFDINEYNKRFYNSNVVIKAESKAVHYPEHWGGLSIKTAENGTEYYQTKNSFYAVDDDCYLIFNQGRTYSSYIQSKDTVRSFTLNFAPEFESRGIASFSCGQRNLDDPFFYREGNLLMTEKLYRKDSDIGRIISNIKTMSDDFVTNEHRISEEFTYLLEGMLTMQSNLNKSVLGLELAKRSSKVEMITRLCRARDFMYSSYYSNITLNDICQVACLNQFYFLRQFKKTFKLTPHQFLTLRRLDVAAHLLRTSSQSVADICVACGFVDNASFTKLFKRFNKMTPGEYRLAGKKGQARKTWDWSLSF